METKIIESDKLKRFFVRHLRSVQQAAYVCAVADKLSTTVDKVDTRFNPEKVYREGRSYRCPCCDRIVPVKPKGKFCQWCGQALDWSEEND